MTADWHFFTPLAILAYVVGWGAAVHAILYARTSQSAIAWALGLVMVPYVTILPYLVFGRSRLEGYVRARRIGDARIKGHLNNDEHAAWRPKLGEGEMQPANAPERQRLRALAHLAHTPPLGGNQVRLLIDGAQTFDAIFAAIARARTLIIVQSFIVNDDGLGKRMQAALLKRAAAGVKVYFLVDGIGSYSLPDTYLQALRAGGVEAEKFLAHRGLVNRFQINFRNHRKLVVVDGEIGFVGGMNIGDEYLGLDPALSPWRDTQIEIQGSAVAALQLAFAEDWHWVTAGVPELRLPRAQPCGDMICQVLPSGPADSQDTCLLYFLEAVHSARDRIWLASPYFIPDDALSAALHLAVLRGVDVRLLLPGKADHHSVFLASTLYAHDMVRAGVKVYRMREGFMHSKVVLIDGDAASVGTANLDNRSFRLNFEMTVLTLDAGFAAEVQAMFERDFSHSRLIGREEYEGASRWTKLAARLVRLFSPIL
ncbi:MAG: cardiolipin synthase [Candidatus Protistobacter heckmanni]|nr:cardiolipin synthase [Candidatus Protistobacter heckmanni]